MNALSVGFRPHVKTTKCQQVADAQIAAGARGITLSTLKETKRFYAAGIRDIVYAVGMAPGKLAQAPAQRQQGCDLKIVADSVAYAEAITAFGREHDEVFEVWIDVDVDGHRSGIAPEDDLLITVGKFLQAGGMHVGRALAHAGSSYEYDTHEGPVRVAEQERSGCVRGAERLRSEGVPCDVVSTNNWLSSYRG